MGSSGLDAAILKLLMSPQDPNEPVPVIHRRETVYGITIPFHLLAWAAVIFRLHTRTTGREPGWDDVFVLLAAVLNLISLVAFIGGLQYGLGQHLVFVSLPHLSTVFKWLYVQNATFHTTAFVIKVSLLCQYLRIFNKAGLLRTTSIALLILTCLWGAAFGFISWVPCFPVSGFWDRVQKPAPKCYGFGVGDIGGAIAAFVSFAATNMTLDVAIFLVPTLKYLYARPGQKRKEYLALAALFAFGFLVILFAALRLWSAAIRLPNETASLDITWWYPVTLILGCLEVDFALMACSMPIFWPVIVSTFPGIFVTQEVHVSSQRIHEDGHELERSSVKSMNSQERLTQEIGPYSPKSLECRSFKEELAMGAPLSHSRVVVQKKR